MSESTDFQAMKFAMHVHKNQKRKYTGEPYFTHLAQVAGLVSTVHGDEDILATAWLHDCVEDCGITFYEIEDRFGKDVKDGVCYLSDRENGNRATRKKLACERLSNAPGWVQTIKVCDIISNTSSIIQYDPKFAFLYLKEIDDLLKVLTKADTWLLKIAMEYVPYIKENTPYIDDTFDINSNYLKTLELALIRPLEERLEKVEFMIMEKK